MYPISERELTVSEIAEHWLKHRDDKATASDLVSELLKRFWLGELPLRAPLSAETWERAELLAVLRKVLSEPKVEQLFAPLDEPTTESGEMVVELPPRVKLPAEPTQWTKAALEQAYCAMAQRKDEHYTALPLPIAEFLVRREDFAALCDREGWPRPGFWFRTSWPSQGARSRMGAILACRQWLRDLARSDQAMRTKQSWREEAMRLFSGLTQRGFERAWDKDTPASWRRSGRRPKT